MNRFTGRGEYHGLTGHVKFELHSLVLGPGCRNAECELEPMVGPGRTELVPFFGWLISLSLGLGKGRLCVSGWRPNVDLDVLDIIETMGVEQSRKVVATIVPALTDSVRRVIRFLYASRLGTHGEIVETPGYIVQMLWFCKNDDQYSQHLRPSPRILIRR